MFGPEMWIRESHSGDACSTPVIVAGQSRYIMAIFSLDQNDLPYDILLSLLMTMRYSLEKFLDMQEFWQACGLISEESLLLYTGSIRTVPAFCQQQREKAAGREGPPGSGLPELRAYSIQKGLGGKSTIRKEITWITQDRTYEDVTSVLPVKLAGRVESVIIISMAIEDLKTTIAHATGYSSRYSLYSMVGNSNEFLALQHKAARVAGATTICCSRGNRVRANSAWLMVFISQSPGGGTADYGTGPRRSGKPAGSRVLWLRRRGRPCQRRQPGTGQRRHVVPGRD